MAETRVNRDRASESDNFQQLEERVLAAMERFHVPGVALGLISGDQMYMAGFGITNIDHPLPVDADTLFQIGSTTKTFTGTAAMRLTEQGILDLDLPIRHYLPELRLADQDVANRVTLRHLFSHTGGWLGDYFDDTGRGDDALAKMVDSMVNLPQLTPLGELWSYNNAGFYLAGRVLEVVANKPYEAIVQELVLDPLGMTHSFFFPEDVMTCHFAVGHTESYEANSQGPEVARPWALARSAHPTGGLISTVRDQLRYARFHLGDGRLSNGDRILSTAAMAEMQFPRVAAADGQFIGVTWFVQEMGGVRIIRHGGATNGQVSAFILVPSRQFAITVLTNADRGSELNRDVTSWALEHHLGLHDIPPEPLHIAEEQLIPYIGQYSAPASDVSVSIRNGRLLLQLTAKGGFPTPDSPPPPSPPPVQADLCIGDQVVILDDPMKGNRAEFLRNEDGQIMWLRLGSRLHRRESAEATIRRRSD